MAGLLQDLAVPALAHVSPKRYGPLLEHWHEVPESRLEDLERSEFGWDHGHIGASMAETWELPQGLTCAIGGHHWEPDASVPHAVRLVGHLRETDDQPSVDCFVEACRSEGGLQPDVVLRHVTSAFEEASALAAALA